MMSAKFPQRMLELLQQMAAEKPDAAHGGPWQYADGTPVQMDAQAALKWIRRAADDHSIAHGARQIVAELQDSPKSALSALIGIVQAVDTPQIRILSDLLEECRIMARRGDGVAAVKKYRHAAKCSLREAHDAVLEKS